MLSLDVSYFTWKRVGVGFLAALVLGVIWVSQPDVGLGSARDVTLKAGHGLYFEATEDGSVVYSKGPVKPTHLFSRIVKRRGWQTYIYLQTHFGSFLRYNPSSRKIDASGNPDQFGSFELDPELVFVQWRSGRITHPMKQENATQRKKEKSTPPTQQEAVSKSAMSAGDAPDLGDLEGDLVIRSREDLRRVFGYRSIKGDVRIVGTALENLDELATLRTIGGTLVIEGNPKLVSLRRLRGLESVGGALIIRRNKSLTNLLGLRNLQSLGGKLVIEGNGALTRLSGLGSMREHQGLELINNQKLRECSEDYLLEHPAFAKDKVELIAHRVARQGWKSERKCKEPVDKYHDLIQQVLDRAMKQMQEALARLDDQLEAALKQEEARAKKMAAQIKAASNRRAKQKPPGAEDDAASDSTQSLASTNFLMPSFGNEEGMVGEREKESSGQLMGPCVLKGKVRSAEERRKRCQVKRKKWRSMMSLPAFFYVLQSTQNPDQRHIEWGSTPAERLALHNRGLIMETANLAPWSLIYKRKLPTGHKARALVERLRKNILEQQDQRNRIGELGSRYQKNGGAGSPKISN